MQDIPYAELSSISLYPLGTEDNIIDSHVKILHQDSMRGNTPYPYGISDEHMGSISHLWRCGTCLYGKKLCPGHFGSVYLNYPVLSSFFMKDILKWVKIICFNCGKLIIPYKKLPIRKDKILGEYAKLVRTSSKDMICIHCKSLHPHITKDKSDPVSIYMEIYDSKASNSSGKGLLAARSQLYPHQIDSIFNKISDQTVLEMGKPLACHPRKFIIRVLKAPPNQIRPDIQKISGGRSNNNDVTVLLQAIVKINESIPNVIPTNVDQDLGIQIHNLNLAVHDMIKGSTGAGKRTIVNNSKKPLTSISKRLPRKYGRIRRNLMGRRASHMARSFITCDPSLRIDEVGIPISIARNIPMPVIVREYNYEECMIYFMNGIERYPGASKVKKANGKEYYIKFVEKLEIGDTIYRDVINGDYVNFNRQPSLLPSNISSMRVVIMEKGDTIRLNVMS
jgi:DNA-directed RNA polymerase beta' subunit